MSGILCPKGDNVFFDNLFKAYKEKDVMLANKCMGVLQAFLNQPRKVIEGNVQAFNKKIQAISVSTDFPLMLGESFTITIGQDNFDLGYEQAFQDVPKTPGKNFWSVVAGATSLTFVKVPEGGKLVVNGKTGDKTYFFVDKYGGALGWTWEAEEFRDIFGMIQDATLFRNKFYSSKANIFYALLQAAAALTGVTAYDAGADGQLRRDIRTINQAIYDLTFPLRNKGYGDTANAGVIIYASRALENRINAALRASTDAMATQQTGAEQITSRPVRVIYTYNQAIAANRPIVVLPGITVTKQDYMMPTTFVGQQDILTLNKDVAVWAAYGGGIGDHEQCRNFLLS